MATLSEEIKKLQGLAVVDPKSIVAKQDEGQRLQRDYEYKQKDAQAAYNRRREEVMTPISNAIYQALQEYAKKNGYAVVLDVTTLGAPNQPRPFLGFEPSAKITKDFITYYNARPATTATTATPKP